MSDAGGGAPPRVETLSSSGPDRATSSEEDEDLASAVPLTGDIGSEAEGSGG